MNPKTQLTPTILYLGVDDNDIQMFENQYPVPRGISYNSYLVRGSEASALFDSVDSRRLDEWKALVEGAAASCGAPDYMVVLHVEPDHTGGIVWALSRFPDMKLLTSQMAVNMLGQFFAGADIASRAIPVKEGTEISLGNRTLRFHTVSMIHWPEVIMAYDTKEHVLFSADAFGRFGGLGYGEEYWDTEGRRYYTNIVGKYGPQVQNLLKKLSGTQIDMIASLHGSVLNKNLDHYLHLYNLWSTYAPELPEGVLVAYASIYGGTAAAALNAAELIGMKGVEVATVDLCRQDASIALAQAFRMGRMLLASVTYDASLFPAMNNFLYRLASKGLCRRRVALIENGTWAPVAAKLMRDRLSAMKDMEIVEPTLTIRSRLHDADRPQLDALIAALTA